MIVLPKIGPMTWPVPRRQLNTPADISVISIILFGYFSLAALIISGIAGTIKNNPKAPTKSCPIAIISILSGK